ncbi:MAG TPA: hypothetical protein VF438_01325 [Candidatus Paceibacterota bacterium]
MISNIRYKEIILKILFFVGIVYVLATKQVSVASQSFLIVLAIGFILGIILIYNKQDPSYRYPKNYRHNNRVLIMRKIEGILLVVFPFALLILNTCLTPN